MSDSESGRGILARLKFQAETADDRGQDEDAKRHFGQWDPYDPVVLALVELVQAQSDLAQAICNEAYYGGAERQVELEIEARLKAAEAIDEEPR
jgi:hypothetical protein